MTVEDLGNKEKADESQKNSCNSDQDSENSFFKKEMKKNSNNVDCSNTECSDTDSGEIVGDGFKFLDGLQENQEIIDSRSLEESELKKVIAQKESLQKSIENLNNELIEEKDKRIRLLAEFDNFRKQSVKQRDLLLKYQGEGLINDLLLVYDTFSLAVDHADNDLESFAKGMKMLFKIFTDTFARWEVRSEPSIGQEFDPFKHNALSSESSDDFQKGFIIKELKKAVYYKDKLLRPAEVIVSDGLVSDLNGETERNIESVSDQGDVSEGNT